MIYLAAPFFTEEQVDTLKLIEGTLERLGHKFFSPRLIGGVLNDMTPEERAASLLKVFDSNINGMASCDLMLAGLGWKDTGTTWELGFWYGYGNGPILTYAFNSAKVNVMLSQSVDGHLSSVAQLEEFFSNTNTGCWEEQIGKFLFDEQGTSE